MVGHASPLVIMTIPSSHASPFVIIFLPSDLFLFVNRGRLTYREIYAQARRVRYLVGQPSSVVIMIIPFNNHPRLSLQKSAHKRPHLLYIHVYLSLSEGYFCCWF